MPITEKQREQRKKHLGSSDIAAILGVDPWRNAYDVWLEKTDQLEDKEAAVYAKAGNIFEESVLNWAEQEKLGKLVRNQYRVAEGFPVASNIDAIVSVSGNPVEAKTAGLFGPLVEQWGDDGTDQVPDRVIIQSHTHMLCTDKEICYCPVFLGGRGFQMFQVIRDNEIISAIQDKSLDFWENFVVSKVAPPNVLPSLPIAKRIRREPEKIVEVDIIIVENWLKAKEALKIQEGIEKSAKAELLAALGDAEGGKCELGLLTYLEQSRSGIDMKRLRDEKPDIYQEYEKISRFRVMRLKKPKPPKGAVIH